MRKYSARAIYSYIEKGCRKKCSRQSRKALWVVLSWVLHWSPSQFPRNAFEFFPLIEASSHRTMQGKVPLWVVAVHIGTRQLEIIWIWTKQSTTNNYETSNAERWTFCGERIAKRFRLRILSYTVPYEFNILQLLSGIGQRRSKNNVCLLIDHLMNEYIQDCD